MLHLVGQTERKRAVAIENDDKGTVPMAFRCPADIQDKLEALKARGYGASAGLFLMVRAYMEAEAELGPLWWDLERAAAEERVGTGTVLGRLAKASLESVRKAR